MDDYQRTNESEAARLDRNWNELLQELRVTQTGVQILTGFLLAMPLQSGFKDLSDFGITVYTASVVFSMLATLLLIAPVSMHRLLFQRRRKESLVDTGNRLAKGGLATLALAITSVAMLIFTMVFSERVGVAVGAVTLVLFVLTWLLLPLSMRHREGTAGGIDPR